MLHQIGVGKNIGDVRGYRVQRGLEEPRQAEQGSVHVEGAAAATPPALARQCRDTRPSSQQGRGTFEDDPRPALLDQHRVANELNRVAKALFGMQQDRAAGQGTAIPARLREVRGTILPCQRNSYSGQPFSRSPSASQARARFLRALGKSGFNSRARS